MVAPHPPVSVRLPSHHTLYSCSIFSWYVTSVTIHKLIPIFLLDGEADAVSKDRRVGGRAKGDPRSPHSSTLQISTHLAETDICLLGVPRESHTLDFKGWGKAVGVPSVSQGRGVDVAPVWQKE